MLAAILLAGLWLVRVGLRPLGRIEQTAAAIAGGDLSQRVENDDPRTEVGRLGGALNTMLGQIEEAFDERTASEQRLRRFVADASHELRTPLAAVRAYAELFDRGARERPDDLERAMTGIQRESRRMGLLVDDLLLLARLDQGRPLERKPVELGEVARDAVEAARTARPGPRDRARRARARSRWWATASGCGRSSTTCSRTCAPTRRPARPATVRVARERRPGGGRGGGQRARASPTSSSRTPSSASTAAMRRARATPAAPGSASRSPRRSPSRTAAAATVVNEGGSGGPGLTVRVEIPLAAPLTELRSAAGTVRAGQPPLIAAITSTRESRLERRLEARALAIDVDVDVVAQHGPGLAQPVAEPGPALVEARDRLVHARRVDVEAPRQARETAAAAWRAGAGRP